MERTVFLFCILSLVVCAFGVDVNLTAFERPSIKLGGGTVSCENVPSSGITITATCVDGRNPPATMKASSDVNGLFSFDYFTDYPQFPLNAAAARCKVDSVEPAIIESDCCSLDVTSTIGKPVTPAMQIFYGSPPGCVPVPKPSFPVVQLPQSSEPCTQLNRQIISITTTVYSIQEWQIQPDEAASTSEETCAQACMDASCVMYSWNNCGTTCTFYPEGGFALSAAGLSQGTGYDPAVGPFICPTVVARCK